MHIWRQVLDKSWPQMGTWSIQPTIYRIADYCLSFFYRRDTYVHHSVYNNYKMSLFKQSLGIMNIIVQRNVNKAR